MKLVLPVICTIIWIVFGTIPLLGLTETLTSIISHSTVLVLSLLAIRTKALHKTIPLDWGIPLLIMIFLIAIFLPFILRLL